MVPILVSGHIGSGKSTFSKIAAYQFDIPGIDIGAPLKDIVADMFLIPREKLEDQDYKKGQVRQLLIEVGKVFTDFDPNCFSRKVIAAIQEIGKYKRICTVNSIRFCREVEYIRSFYPDAPVVFLESIPSEVTEAERELEQIKEMADVITHEDISNYLTGIMRRYNIL